MYGTKTNLFPYFSDGSTKSSRGRFELAFAQIGGSIMTGAGIGGVMGTIKGNNIDTIQ